MRNPNDQIRMTKPEWRNNYEFPISNSQFRHWKIGAYFLILISSFLILSVPVYAQASKKVLTKADAIRLMTATDFMKRKIQDLLSWTVGYDISKVSRVRLTPTIIYIKAAPKKVPPDGRTIIEVIASVNDPGGLGNIAGVRADLSSIGRLSNTMLVDNGLFGDEKASDGVYTLQTSVSPRIDLGSKELPVAVANKKGWLALAKTSLDISKNPRIIGAKFTPAKVRADGKSKVTLAVEIDNPGRIDDLKNVTADLRALGFTELADLRNDGKRGDARAGDDIFSLQFVIPASVKTGKYNVRVGASNLATGYGTADVALEVYK
jgi:hypothetical protein